jgi:hypothetical protein
MTERADKDEVKAAAGRQGAIARKERLSPARRTEIAKDAAAARWGGHLPQALNEGTLRIGDVDIECAVVQGGTRLINQESFLRAIGRSRSPKGGTGTARMDSVDDLPPFLAAENLKPFITDALRQSTTPILYRTVTGGRAFGYNALLLQYVCDVYLRLKMEGKPTHMQQHVITAAYNLMRGFSLVGIIALVDKATGYEERANRDELIKILEKYIAPEMIPWAKRFPDEFFRELYRLRDWVHTGTSRRTPFVGKLINKYIYDQLPPGVHEEIKRRNPTTETGRRRHKNYWFLTGETGIPHLDDQIKMVTMLMRVSDTKEQFEAMFDKAFKKDYQRRLFAVDVPKQIEADAPPDK